MVCYELFLEIQELVQLFSFSHTSQMGRYELVFPLMSSTITTSDPSSSSLLMALKESVSSLLFPFKYFQL